MTRLLIFRLIVSIFAFGAAGYLAQLNFRKGVFHDLLTREADYLPLKDKIIFALVQAFCIGVLITLGILVFYIPFKI